MTLILSGKGCTGSPIRAAFRVVSREQAADVMEVYGSFWEINSWELTDGV